MRRTGLGVLLLALACDRPRPASPVDAARVVVPVDAAPAAPAPPTAAAEPAAPDPDLPAEEGDRNPRSETVKIKLVITPAVRGTVHWGRKKLWDLQPGKMTLELERPRGSGPLDLLVRADGFLPHHVRLFTDRDDKLSVRLVRATDAHGLLGYRRAAATPPAP